MLLIQENKADFFFESQITKCQSVIKNVDLRRGAGVPMSSPHGRV